MNAKFFSSLALACLTLLIAQIARASSPQAECPKGFTEISDRTVLRKAEAFIASEKPFDSFKSSAPIIESKDLSEVRPFIFQGRQDAYLVASLNGQKVFLKSKPTEHVLLESSRGEAAWLTFLNRIGLGAKFLGVTNVSGRDYLVSEFVEGTLSRFPNLSTTPQKLTRKHLLEMRRQTNALLMLGVAPHDLQFLIAADGRVVLIDPELWAYHSAYDPKGRQKSIEEASMYLDAIEQNWRNAGKFEETPE